MMANQKRASIPAADDPIVTAVLYCVRLEYVDPAEPLFGVSYIGQAVRPGTPEEVANARWKEEIWQASRENKQIGFIAALEIFGKDAFSWTIIESREGPRSEMQAYADAGEVRLIAEEGGTLQSMAQRLRQSFNQTTGGKGNATNWASIDAFRANCFDKFQREMEVYVEEFNTSLVPHSYVNPLTNYTLGSHLTRFREGKLWKGSPRQTEIIEWAEALPRWAWNSLKTEEFREGCAERGREQWENADEETKARWRANQKAACNTPEHREAVSKRSRDQWKNADEETRAERLAKITATNRAKTEARLALLTPKERKIAEKLIAKAARAYAKKAADLRLLRTEMPNAQKSDLPRARRDGTLAKAQAAARAAAKAGAGSSSDPVDPVEVAPMSDGDSDSD